MKTRLVLGPEEEKPAPDKPRPRNRERTCDELQSAMQRVKDKGLKLSITAVAAEAGVTPGLIHNTYTEIADVIRAQVGRATRQQRDEKASELAMAKAQLRNLRTQLKEVQADSARLASQNETLRDELATQRVIASGKVI